MSRRRRWISLAAAAIAGLGLLPPVQARLKAVGVLTEALGLPFPRPFAHEITRRETELSEVRGDLYSSSTGAPALVLLPGAAPKGKDDPRAIRLAEALARAGRTVFVPDLALAQRRFTGQDIERIVVATEALVEDTGHHVGLVGISFGGSFALIAAADDRIADDIEQVAVFGAYFDLIGVIQAISSGFSVVNGREIPWEADPRALDVLRFYSLNLVSEAARPALSKALEGKRASEELPPAARAVYELVMNRDPERSYALAGRLGPLATRTLHDFSPSSVADGVKAPVVALHSIDDPVVPYGEAVRLEETMPDVRLLTVEVFHHVDLEGVSLLKALPDLFNIWRFTSWVISAQE